MFLSIGDGFDYNKRKALEYTKLTLFFFQSDHPVNLPGRLILTFNSTFYNYLDYFNSSCFPPS